MGEEKMTDLFSGMSGSGLTPAFCMRNMIVVMWGVPKAARVSRVVKDAISPWRAIVRFMVMPYMEG